MENSFKIFPGGKLIISLLIMSTFLIKCGKNTQSGISYSRDIQTIFQYNCTSCHGNTSPSGGLSLTNYDSLMAGGNSGPVVRPKAKPEFSLLYKKVAYSEDKIPFGSRMPPNGPYLDESQIKYIWQWINNGAKNN